MGTEATVVQQYGFLDTLQAQGGSASELRYTSMIDHLRSLQGIEQARNIVLIYIDPDEKYSSPATQPPIACGEIVYSAHERTHISAVPELRFIYDIPEGFFDGAVVVLPPRYCELPLGQKSARLLKARLDPEIETLGQGFVSKVGRGKFVWFVDPKGEHPYVSNAIGEMITGRMGLERGDITPWKS